jgi:ribonuclease-3
MPSHSLERLQKSLAYHFLNPTLLKQALTHRSADPLHNERLEFLGDAVLGSVIANQLFIQFPKADEGVLSRLRAYLVRGKTLAELANVLQLGDYLYLGAGELKSKGYQRISTLSDAFEAIIGAVLLDSDYQTAQTYILKRYVSKLASLSINMASKDPKTNLQEWLQSNNYSIPFYKMTHSIGKDHKKYYWVECSIEYKSHSLMGKGLSIKKAEQDAAQKMLSMIA